MLKLIKWVVGINCAATLVVFVLSKFVPQFQTTNLVDFLFFVVLVIWIVAKLMWEGGIYSKTALYDDSVSAKTSRMVRGYNFEKQQRIDSQYNFQTGLIWFIAGLPALITCFILQFT